jgi:hypothetical protein
MQPHDHAARELDDAAHDPGLARFEHEASLRLAAAAARGLPWLRAQIEATALDALEFIPGFGSKQPAVKARAVASIQLLVALQPEAGSEPAQEEWPTGAPPGIQRHGKRFVLALHDSHTGAPLIERSYPADVGVPGMALASGSLVHVEDSRPLASFDPMIDLPCKPDAAYTEPEPSYNLKAAPALALPLHSAIAGFGVEEAVRLPETPEGELQFPPCVIHCIGTAGGGLFPAAAVARLVAGLASARPLLQAAFKAAVCERESERQRGAIGLLQELQTHALSPCSADPIAVLDQQPADASGPLALGAAALPAIARLLACDRMGLFVPDPNGGEQLRSVCVRVDEVPAAAHGLVALKSKSWAAACFREARVLCSCDAARLRGVGSEDLPAGARALSALYLPIIHSSDSSRVLGVLHACNKLGALGMRSLRLAYTDPTAPRPREVWLRTEAGGAFTNDDLPFARLLADQLACALVAMAHMRALAISALAAERRLARRAGMLGALGRAALICDGTNVSLVRAELCSELRKIFSPSHAFALAVNPLTGARTVESVDDEQSGAHPEWTHRLPSGLTDGLIERGAELGAGAGLLADPGALALPPTADKALAGAAQLFASSAVEILEGRQLQKRMSRGFEARWGLLPVRRAVLVKLAVPQAADEPHVLGAVGLLWTGASERDVTAISDSGSGEEEEAVADRAAGECTAPALSTDDSEDLLVLCNAFSPILSHALLTKAVDEMVTQIGSTRSAPRTAFQSGLSTSLRPAVRCSHGERFANMANISTILVNVVDSHASAEEAEHRSTQRDEDQSD